MPKTAGSVTSRRAAQTFQGWQVIDVESIADMELSYEALWKVQKEDVGINSFPGCMATAISTCNLLLMLLVRSSRYICIRRGVFVV